MKKQFRIQKNQEFQTILKRKRFKSSPTIVIYYQPKVLEVARVGITVSKKIGNAVTRNKIKRQIRMMTQTLLNFDEPYDFIVMIRKQYLDFSYQENFDNYKHLVDQLNQEFKYRR